MNTHWEHHIKDNQKESIALLHAAKTAKLVQQNFMNPGDQMFTLGLSSYLFFDAQNFVLAPIMREVLMNTDFSTDLIVGDVPLPYPAFYISFDREEDGSIVSHKELPVFNKMRCYGAYVYDITDFKATCAKSISLMLHPITMATDMQISFCFAGRGEGGVWRPSFSLNMTLLKDEPISAQMDDMVWQMRGIFSEQEQLTQDSFIKEAMNQMTCLVFNTCLYLSVSNARTKKLPEPGGLAKLKRRREQTPDHKEAYKIYSRKIIEKISTNTVIAPGIEERIGYTLEYIRETPHLHWRRGHLRRQAWGKQWCKRRTIFLAPMLVGEGESTQRKQYSVRG